MMSSPLSKRDIENLIDRTVKRIENNDSVATVLRSFVEEFAAHNQRREQKEKIKQYIDVASLALIAGTVIFSLLTWLAIRGQLNEMKVASDQTNKIVQANIALSDAAKKQADAAITAQRAWVGAMDARIEGSMQPYHK
jgi:hypothetical protein